MFRHGAIRSLFPALCGGDLSHPQLSSSISYFLFLLFLPGHACDIPILPIHEGVGLEEVPRIFPFAKCRLDPLSSSPFPSSRDCC